MTMADAHQFLLRKIHEAGAERIVVLPHASRQMDRPDRSISAEDILRFVFDAWRVHVVA